MTEALLEKIAKAPEGQEHVPGRGDPSLNGLFRVVLTRAERNQIKALLTQQPVTQEWVNRLSFMQQSVLLSAIRGCDGLPKRHKAKTLVKWYRRCVLLSAFDGKALTDAFAPGGGSFTGPIAPPPHIYAESAGPDLAGKVPGEFGIQSEYDWRCSMLQKVADDFVDSRDELPAHYQVHFMHAAEIVGYKHPDPQIAEFWRDIYERLAKAYHLWPETVEQMDRQLGDHEDQWRERNDRSTSCSD